MLPDRPPMTTSSLVPSASLSASDETKLRALVRLSSHYWRPGATPAQGEAILEDFLTDLSDMSADTVERACMAYRMNGQNRFFPTPGQLREALKPPPGPEPRLRLETFRGYPEPMPRATASVADVLRKHGMESAARGYEAWKERRG